MKPCIVKTVNRFTVAGTVYEFHVLPYSPAFKPAPVTRQRTMLSLSYKKNVPGKKQRRPSSSCMKVLHHIDVLYLSFEPKARTYRTSFRASPR